MEECKFRNCREPAEALSNLVRALPVKGPCNEISFPVLPRLLACGVTKLRVDKMEDSRNGRETRQTQ